MKLLIHLNIFSFLEVYPDAGAHKKLREDLQKLVNSQPAAQAQPVEMEPVLSAAVEPVLAGSKPVSATNCTPAARVAATDFSSWRKVPKPSEMCLRY